MRSANKRAAPENLARRARVPCSSVTPLVQTILPMIRVYFGIIFGQPPSAAAAAVADAASQFAYWQAAEIFVKSCVGETRVILATHRSWGKANECAARLSTARHELYGTEAETRTSLLSNLTLAWRMSCCALSSDLSCSRRVLDSSGKSSSPNRDRVESDPSSSNV